MSKKKRDEVCTIVVKIVAGTIDLSSGIDKLTEMIVNRDEIDLLERLSEYMENIADADGDSDGMHPNEEMTFQIEIDEILEKQ